ncbi:hypothetical protein EYR41_000445 [Orbilia oligospora]|uniref:Uncharacterized protein n=1 Tax=Orbilia oligospora TaxID=2813651 RepID=A0A7C8K9E8_ORBOL|nr:hypothetical protein TWF751_009008 [Orbilia oligospora]TGJ73339.1 hypothetical protein EYR41_000445 [Orbilia oligospora]
MKSSMETCRDSAEAYSPHVYHLFFFCLPTEIPPHPAIYKESFVTIEVKLYLKGKTKMHSCKSGVIHGGRRYLEPAYAWWSQRQINPVIESVRETDPKVHKQAQYKPGKDSDGLPTREAS